MSSKKYLNDIGEVRSGKEGMGNYIVITKDVTLPKGTKVYTESVESIISRLIEKGIISAEEGESRLEKKPSYVLSKLNAVIG